MKKIAIIGASYLQNPLILKAKEMKLETHVFAWECGDIGEKTADFFYPISIREKEEILSQCKKIGIDGICTIASDLAVVTVNYVAEAMGLTGNSMEATWMSTNKGMMRQAFFRNNIPSPMSFLVENINDLPVDKRDYPLIVKPTDRSGSRGINKVYDEDMLSKAIEEAKALSFERKALVEEFAEGEEYSAETISFNGKHTLLSVTKKYTTGNPHYIETGHIEPAPGIDFEIIKNVIYPALDALHIKNGASHSEFKIDSKGNIKIIEIGGRMGGDFIGSHLVKMSTGIDFIAAVIEVALGNEPDLTCGDHYSYSGVRFILSQNDCDALNEYKMNKSDLLDFYQVDENFGSEVCDSSSRHGLFLFHSSSLKEITDMMTYKNDYYKDNYFRL